MLRVSALLAILYGAAPVAAQSNAGLPGVLFVGTSRELVAEADCLVAEAHVVPGDSVHAGQTLLLLEAPALDAAAHAAEAAVVAAVALAERGRIELASAERILRTRMNARDVYSSEEIRARQVARDVASAEHDAALSAADQRRAELVELRRLQEGLIVRAPTAGVIDWLTVRSGMHILKGTKLVRIADRRDLWVRFAAPPEFASRVSRGARVRVAFQEGAQSLEAEVASLPPHVDHLLGTVLVEARVLSRKPGQEWPRPGLSVRVFED